MNKIVVGVLLAVGLLGCSRKLSKEDAEKAIRAKWFAKDEINCSWKQFFQQDGSGATIDYRTHLTAAKDQPQLSACMAALQAKEIIEAPRCFEKYYRSEECSDARIKPGKNGTFHDGKIWFKCSTHTVQVVSITTEAKTAAVKFEVDRTKNEELLKSLEACVVDTFNKFGKASVDAQFARDDDGNWQINSK